MGATTKQLKDHEDSEGKPQWGSARFGPDSVLVVHIRDAAEPIIVRPGEEVILGRYDPISGSTPGLDLSLYNAVDKGVSRLHAVIRRQGDALNLVDLGSANSTYLNGQRLVPHQPRVLRDGDEVRLGRLVLQVYFRHDVPA
ncbi:MAG: FHA domain-containing protein [Anaerolineae bacterium]|nr:FHA domain-containing protein [Anaerolineae bacterium]